jgi:drug/metabolite transporter (DMT)-like permease
MSPLIPAVSAERASLAIALIVAAYFAFSLSDAMAKWLGQTYAPVEVVFFRHFFGMLPAAFFVWRAGGVRALATRRPGLHVLRAALLFVAFLGFIWGLTGLPFAEAIAIGFTAPLFITALSGPLLGEQVGIRRWSAVAVGFVGMLIMVRPGTEAFSFHAVLVLVSALAFALSMLLTRRMSRSESNVAMLVYTSGGGLLLCLPALPFVWLWPAADELWRFVFLGVVGGSAAYVMIAAHRHAPAVVLAPYVYTTLIWATAIGWVVWREVPDAWTWVGALVIVAAGVYIAHREARRAGLQ